MLKGCVKYILLLLLTLHVGSFAFSQTGFESEDELKKQAAQYFEEGNYPEAYPLYSQLLSNYPKDPEYNYKFGACMLFVEEDKNAALRYLEYAAARPNVDPEAIFYLGKGYHFNYRFEEARAKYQQFKEKTTVKEHEKYTIDQHITMCTNGTKLLRNITDLAVLDKKTLNRADFFRTYDISSFGGKLIVKPEDFQLAADKKKDETTVMYINPEIERLYFSSYGEKGKEGKDIYYVNRLPDGNWGEPQNIGTTINTPYDEDYPFFNAETNTLYFASKGHNSMGGYDVFKSYYDPNTGTWSKPINLDFAINTPDDDYLYITDKDERTAYFASTRTNISGEVSVYKVSVDRIPVDFAIIKGKFSADNTLSAKITIENTKTGNTEGIFNTDSLDGDYVITIPNGGNYKFVIETAKSDVAYTGNVEIPKLKTSKPLKQEISVVVENGYEKLIIKNLFDEEIDEAGFALSPDLLKRKADLAVNTTEEELAQQQAQNQKPEEPVVSNEEILKIAYEDAQAIETEANEIKEKSEIAYAVANDKNTEALKKLEEAKDFEDLAAETTSETEKNEFTSKANALQEEAKILAEESVIAYDLGAKLDEEFQKKKATSDEALEYALQMDEALNSSSPENFQANLDYITKLIEKRDQRTLDEVVADAGGNFEEQRQATDKQVQLAIKLKERVDELEGELSEVQGRAGNTKDKTEKQFLLDEAVAIEKDLNEMKVKAEDAMKLAKVMQEKTDKAEKNADLVDNVIKAVQATSSDAIVLLSEEEKNNLETNITSTTDEIKTIESLANADTGATETEIIEEGQGVGSVEVVDDVAEEVKQQKYQEELAKTFNTDYIEQPSSDEDYESYYETKETALSDQDEATQQAGSVELYGSWQESLNADIAAKQAQLASTEDVAEQEQLTSEIAALEAQKEAVSSKLATSIATYNAANNTSITGEEIAMLYGTTEDTGTTGEITTGSETTTAGGTEEPLVSIEQSGVEEETGSVSNETLAQTFDTDFIEQPSSDEDYESYYESKETALSDQDEATQQAGSVELYGSWQESLNADIAAKQAQLTSTEDAAEQEQLSAEIATLASKQAEVSDKLATSLATYNAANNTSITGEEIAMLYGSTEDTGTTGEITTGSETTTAGGTEEPLVSIEHSDVEEETGSVSNETLAQTFDTDFIEQPSSDEDYESYYETKETALSDQDEATQQAGSVELYGSWQESLNADIAAKQTQLASTEDVAKQEQLTSEIAALEAQKEAVSSKLATSIATYNAANNTSITGEEIAMLYGSTEDTGTTGEITPGSETTTAGGMEEPLVSIEQSGVEEETGSVSNETLAQTFDTDFIEQPSSDEDYESYYESKETALSDQDEATQQAGSVELYGSWQESLNADIAAKQAKLSSTEDVAEQEQLTSEIAALEAQKEAVSSKLATSIATYNAANNTSITGEEIAMLYGSTEDTGTTDEITTGSETTTEGGKEEPLVSVETTGTETEGTMGSQGNNESDQAIVNVVEENAITIEDDYSEYYQNKLTTLDNVEDPIEKEGFKSTVYGNWIEKLNEDLEATNQALVTADGAEREELVAKKSTIQKEIENKTTIKSMVDKNLLALTGSTDSSENEIAQNNTTTTRPLDEEQEESNEQNENVAINTSGEQGEEQQTEQEQTEQTSESQAELSVSQDIDETQLISATMQSEVEEADQKVDDLSNKLEGLEFELSAIKDKDEKKVKEAEVITVRAELQQATQEVAFVKNKLDAIAKAEEQIRANPETTVSLSDQYMTNAERFEQEAETLVLEAKALRDSAETVKKDKDKEPLIAQAEELEKQAEDKRDEAENNKTIANEVKMAEQHTANLMKEAEAAAQTVASSETTNENIAVDEAIANTEEYVEYNKLVREAESMKQEAEMQKQQAIALEAAAEEARKQLQEISAQLEATDDSEEVNRLSVLTTDLEDKLNEIMAMLDSIKTAASQLQAEANMKEQAANEYLQTLDQGTADQIVAYQEQLKAQEASGTVASSSQTGTEQESELATNETETNINRGSENNDAGSGNTSGNEAVSDNASTTTEDVLANVDTESLTIETAAEIVDVMPTKLTKEIFVQETTPQKSPYSTTKPIPIDGRHPEGLVFKVQVGAFRNPIPQDLFKGFAPITGERTNSGLTRYMAGLFNDLDRAFSARDDIRGFGYSDAFVVAYYNGNRISIPEARTLITGGTIDRPLADNAGQGSGTGTTSSGSVSTSGSNQNGVAVSSDVKTVNGLFYTVQVGVYTREVPASQLYNITPLNKDFMDNGNVRYSSGIYNDITVANQAKDGIRAIGIADAFVTAYYNGNRITLAEARNLIEQNGNGILATGTASSSARFTVYLGEYSGEVPNDVAGAILDLNSKGVEKEQLDNGTTKYTVGKFSNRSDAEKVKSEAIKKGIANAEVIEIGNSVSQNNTTNEIGVSGNIEFKLKVGSYGTDVPVQAAGVILQYSSRVERVNDATTGSVTYMINGLNTYEEANQLKQDISNANDGFSVEIIAFENGIQITIDEARRKTE